MSTDIQPKIFRAQRQTSLDVWPPDQIRTSQIVGRVGVRIETRALLEGGRLESNLDSRGLVVRSRASLEFDHQNLICPL